MHAVKNIFKSIAWALLLFQACGKNTPEVVPPVVSGTSEQKYYVENWEGDIDIPVPSDKAGTVSLLNPADDAWLQLGATSFSANGSIRVHILKNDGFKRRADILFTTTSRKDTAYVFQNGAKEEIFHVSMASMVVYNGHDEVNTVATDINVPLESIKTEIRYSGNEAWIKDCQLESSALRFKTTDNTDVSSMRTAQIILTFTDGWKDAHEAAINVLQARADNYIGTVFTPEDLRSVATVDGYTLPEDALADGFIVSTTEGGNAGDAVVDNYESDTGVIDYSLTARTAYLESPDGEYGFRLITTTEVENAFQRYSRVLLRIGGAVVKRSEGEPQCYSIEGVKSSEILSSSDGWNTMPWKEKHISELTDNDLNTLVKIKDCEIVMRKGPFTPVDESYTSSCGCNRLAKFPILIRDIEGGSMYLFTNMTCPYRRDGNILPYGSGNITGIVVHESYKSFEKNGDIGRYQLRHLTRGEIDLKQDFADNFSGIITEFRYAKFPAESEETKLPKAILATKGNGELCHTFGTISNFSPSYFYIGRCGSDRKGRYAEGAGIELDYGGIYSPWTGKEDDQNTDGTGWFKDDLLLSWSSKYWWDSANYRGYCWLVTFSTEGIVSDRVSMQFAMYNNSPNARSPRYWKAQYSIGNFDTSVEMDCEWIDIGEFTVPDVAIRDSQNDWQTLGTRVYDFQLPTEILGHDCVSIRLMPRNNRAAGIAVDSYDSSTIANNVGYNTMDYFAVRYNK